VELVVLVLHHLYLALPHITLEVVVEVLKIQEHKVLEVMVAVVQEM
jgi:hypothetical protein